jgi:hypothetical protein
MSSLLKSLDTLTAYVIGVLIVWAVIFAVGYVLKGSTPGYPLLHVFGGFLLRDWPKDLDVGLNAHGICCELARLSTTREASVLAKRVILELEARS